MAARRVHDDAADVELPCDAHGRHDVVRAVRVEVHGQLPADYRQQRLELGIRLFYAALGFGFFVAPRAREGVAQQRRTPHARVGDALGLAPVRLGRVRAERALHAAGADVHLLDGPAREFQKRDLAADQVGTAGGDRPGSDARAHGVRKVQVAGFDGIHDAHLRRDGLGRFRDVVDVQTRVAVRVDEAGDDISSRRVEIFRPRRGRAAHVAKRYYFGVLEAYEAVCEAFALHREHARVVDHHAPATSTYTPSHQTAVSCVL